jgi:hypothetical protein
VASGAYLDSQIDGKGTVAQDFRSSLFFIEEAHVGLFFSSPDQLINSHSKFELLLLVKSEKFFKDL